MQAGKEGGFDDFSQEEERLKALEFAMREVRQRSFEAPGLEDKLSIYRHFATLEKLRNEIRRDMWTKRDSKVPQL